MTALWRVEVDGRARLARGATDRGPEELLEAGLDLDTLLGVGGPSFDAALTAPGVGRVPEGARVLAPVESQEVWAAGVTYLVSRDARMAESDAPDFYARVAAAERPEVFFKATADRVRGPGEAVGIRADSAWDVPEPELAVVVDAAGRIVAATIGNDVSSRSIEGENPLYLPQAKTYTGSCALGPCLVPVAAIASLQDLEIDACIERSGAVVFAGSVSTARMQRTVDDLVTWLLRALDFPRGVVLMTGTALVPDDGFTLAPGDRVTIRIAGIGELTNHVERVGHRGSVRTGSDREAGPT